MVIEIFDQIPKYFTYSLTFLNTSLIIYSKNIYKNEKLNKREAPNEEVLTNHLEITKSLKLLHVFSGHVLYTCTK